MGGKDGAACPGSCGHVRYLPLWRRVWLVIHYEPLRLPYILDILEAQRSLNCRSTSHAIIGDPSQVENAINRSSGGCAGGLRRRFVEQI